VIDRRNWCSSFSREILTGEVSERWALRLLGYWKNRKKEPKNF
jgi:hypothetical protein